MSAKPALEKSGQRASRLYRNDADQIIFARTSSPRPLPRFRGRGEGRALNHEEDGPWGNLESTRIREPGENPERFPARATAVRSAPIYPRRLSGILWALTNAAPRRWRDGKRKTSARPGRT